MMNARYVTCLVYQTLAKGEITPFGEDKTRHCLIHHATRTMPGRYWSTFFKELKKREAINTVALSYTQPYRGVPVKAGHVNWSHDPVNFL